MSSDVLAGLRGYHLPEPVHWWPPALGWWLAAVVVALALVLVWLRRRRRRARLRAPALALSELARLRARWEADGDDMAFVRELAQLIRRYAIARWPADEVAGLTGAGWRSYLARKCADAPVSARAALDGPLGEAITLWPYQPSADAAPPALADAAAVLIRHGAGGDREVSP